MNTENHMGTDPNNPPSPQHWNKCLEEVAKTRSKAAFMAFYDHFAPRLKSWLSGLTQDSQLAEELVQESMLSVWRKASQFNSTKASASTWLFRIARNLLIDHQRRRQVRDRIQPEVELEQTSDLTLAVNSPRLHEALVKLPQQQKQVLYKSYFEGKSHQEIANDMDIPLGSVKSSLRLGFQKLSNAMRERL